MKDTAFGALHNSTRRPKKNSDSDSDDSASEDVGNDFAENSAYPCVEAVETGAEFQHLSFAAVGDYITAVNGVPLTPSYIDKATATVEGLSPYYVAFQTAINKAINDAKQQKRESAKKIADFEEEEGDGRQAGIRSGTESVNVMLKAAKAEMSQVDELFDDEDILLLENEKETVPIELTIQSSLSAQDAIDMLKSEEKTLQQLLLSDEPLTQAQMDRVRAITDDVHNKKSKPIMSEDNKIKNVVSTDSVLSANNDTSGGGGGLSSILENGLGVDASGASKGDTLKQWARRKRQMELKKLEAEKEAQAARLKLQAEDSLRAMEKEISMKTGIPTPTKTSALKDRLTTKASQAAETAKNSKQTVEEPLSRPLQATASSTSSSRNVSDKRVTTTPQKRGTSMVPNRQDSFADAAAFIEAPSAVIGELSKRMSTNFFGAPAIDIDDNSASSDEESELKKRLKKSQSERQRNKQDTLKLKKKSIKASYRKASGSQLNPSAQEFVLGGAPHSGVADSDLDLKDALFTQPKLGIDIIAGDSLGHLPVLGLPTIASGNGVELEAGDQLVSIGSTSLIGESKPFQLAVNTLKTSPKRPILLQFQSLSKPAPYTVTFAEKSLGIQIEPGKAYGGGGLPVVWDTEKCTQKFPKIGDSLIAVGGIALSHPTDKLAEAISLLGRSPRPVVCLFKPGNVDPSLLLPPPPPPAAKVIPPSAKSRDKEVEEEEHEDNEEDDNTTTAATAKYKTPTTLVFHDSVIVKTEAELNEEAEIRKAHERKVSSLFSIGAHVRLSNHVTSQTEADVEYCDVSYMVPKGSVGVVLKRLNGDEMLEEGGDSDNGSDGEDHDEDDDDWFTGGAKVAPRELKSKKSFDRKPSFDFGITKRKASSGERSVVPRVQRKPPADPNRPTARALVMFPQTTLIVLSSHVEAQQRNYSQSSRAYTVVFPEQKLGLTLGEPGDDMLTTSTAAGKGGSGGSGVSMLPIVESTSDIRFEGSQAVYPKCQDASYAASTVKNANKLSQEWRCPAPGHSLSAVGGSPVLVKGREPYDVAVSLIEAAKRPLAIDFVPPKMYSITFPKPNVGLDKKDNTVLVGGLVCLKANHKRNKNGSYVDVNREVVKRRKPLRTKSLLASLASVGGMSSKAAAAKSGSDTVVEKGIEILSELGIAVSDGRNEPNPSFLHSGNDGVGGAVVRRAGCNVNPLLPVAFDRIVSVNGHVIEAELNAAEAAQKLLILLAAEKTKRPIVLKFASPPEAQAMLSGQEVLLKRQSSLKLVDGANPFIPASANENILIRRSVSKSLSSSRGLIEDGSCGICLKSSPVKPRKFTCGHIHCKECARDITTRGVRDEHACSICKKGFDPSIVEMPSRIEQQSNGAPAQVENDETRLVYEASCRLLIPILRRLARSELEVEMTKIISWNKLSPSVARSLDQGLELLETAASQNHARAQYDLGCYLFDGLDGLGIKGNAHVNSVFTVDKVAGLEWLKKASATRSYSQEVEDRIVSQQRHHQYHGISDAATRVALAYWNGNGITKSMTSASEWYAIAAELKKQNDARELIVTEMKTAATTATLNSVGSGGTTKKALNAPRTSAWVVPVVNSDSEAEEEDEDHQEDDDNVTVASSRGAGSRDSLLAEDKVEVADFEDSEEEGSSSKSSAVQKKSSLNDFEKEGLSRKKSILKRTSEREVEGDTTGPLIDPNSGKMVFRTLKKTEAELAKEQAERDARAAIEQERKQRLLAIKAAEALERDCELTEVENSALIASFHACFTSKAAKQQSGIDRKTFKKLVREILLHQPPSLNLGGRMVSADPSLLIELKDRALDDLFELADEDNSNSVDLDEFLDLYLHIKKAVLRTALARADKTGAVTSPGVLVLLQQKKKEILESQDRQEKRDIKRILFEQETEKRAQLARQRAEEGKAGKAAAPTPTTSGTGGGATNSGDMFSSAASMFGFGAFTDSNSTDPKSGNELDDKANDISAIDEEEEELNIDRFSLAELPRRDRAAAIEQARKIAQAEKEVKVQKLDDGSYTVTYPPLNINNEKLGFQIREAGKRWRCPTVHKTDQRGALRQAPYPGEMVMEVNGILVNKKPLKTASTAADTVTTSSIGSNGGVEEFNLETDFSAFDKCARLLVEGRLSDQPLVVRFKTPKFKEVDAFLEESDDDDDYDDSDDSGDDVSGDIKHREVSGGGGEPTSDDSYPSTTTLVTSKMSDVIKQTSTLKKKHGFDDDDDDGFDDEIGWSSEDEDVEGPSRRPGSAKDYLNDMPPGHVDSDDDTKEFFRKGDKVGWRGSDGEIPEGTVGMVIGFTDQGLIRVTFPYVGTFSMYPQELKEPIWKKKDHWEDTAKPEEQSHEDGSDNYDVIFHSLDFNTKIMENVDRSGPPVVSKAFPGANLMQRGDVLIAIDGRELTNSKRADHRPFNLALDLLSAKLQPPTTLTFAKPASICEVSSVDGEPSMYDATFNSEFLGFDLGNFGQKGRVIRVVATHPIGIPHLGDQLIAINKQSIVNSRDAEMNNNVLAYVERKLSSKQRPLILRFQRSSGEMAEGEILEEARRGFSVLFMSKHLGLTFNLASGLPIIAKTRPLFSSPAQGDVLTAVNGAELSKCGIPVSQLVLLLESLPRPLRLSFIQGSDSLNKGLQSRSRRRIDGHKVEFPEHFLKQVIVPPGRKIGMKLMTVMDRPVVQEVYSKHLKAQGVRPLDVLVSIKNKQLGEITAAEAVKQLKQVKWEEVNGVFKVGFLRMTPNDKNSSYNSQHPIDIAAALTAYHSESRIGILSFSIPFSIPNDKYRVEVFRYGSEIAPSIGNFNENDRFIRINEKGKPNVMTYEEAAAIERINEGDMGREKRLQQEGKTNTDLRGFEIEKLALEHARQGGGRGSEEDGYKSDEHLSDDDHDDDEEGSTEEEEDYDDFQDGREITL